MCSLLRFEAMGFGNVLELSQLADHFGVDNIVSNKNIVNLRQSLDVEISKGSDAITQRRFVREKTQARLTINQSSQTTAPETY